MSSPPTYAPRRPRPRRPSSSVPSSPRPDNAQLAGSATAAARVTSPTPAGPPASPQPGGGSMAEDAAEEEEEEDADEDSGGPGAASPDLPLTMTASVVLSQLPRDATAALAEAGTFPAEAKVVVRFKPVGGSAPPLRRELCKISASQRFEAVVAYLRRTLRVAASDSVFLYVNSTFAPALDEVVGNLHRCFKDSNGQLNVSYSMTPAFG